ncbi:MAG: cytochrome c [Gemmatimonadota bacterium]
MRINWIYPIAAGLLITLAETGAGQDTTTAKPRTTMSGVYTEEQATRGSETFAAQCASCHTPDEHTGPAFLGTWLGKPLSELFVYVVTSMPKSDPGILSQKEYAQLMALLLKANKMPTGPAELPEDSTAMRTITFDTVAAATDTIAVAASGRVRIFGFGQNKHAGQQSPSHTRRSPGRK